MDDPSRLRRWFERANQNPEDGCPAELEDWIGWVLSHEIATNHKLYDQARYNVIFDGLNRAFGWTRMDLHQSVIEARGGMRTFPEPLLSIRSHMTGKEKEMLLKFIDQVILKDCQDNDFRTYLRDRIAAKIE